MVTGHPPLVEILSWHLVVFLVGTVGFIVAIPRTSVAIGAPFVPHPFDPFGRHMAVGITLITLLGATVVGGWRIFRLSGRWTVATLTLLALVVGWLFLAFSIIGAGNVFI